MTVVVRGVFIVASNIISATTNNLWNDFCDPRSRTKIRSSDHSCLGEILQVNYTVYYWALQCKQDPICVFPEMKLLGLVPNFHIHVSVSDLHIPKDSPPKEERSSEYINRSQIHIHEWRNWEWGCPVSFLGISVSNFRYSVFAVRPRYAHPSFMAINT